MLSKRREIFFILLPTDGPGNEGGLEGFRLSLGMLGGGALLQPCHDPTGSSPGDGTHLAQLPMIRVGTISQAMPLAKKKEKATSPAHLPNLDQRLRTWVSLMIPILKQMEAKQARKEF